VIKAGYRVRSTHTKHHSQNPSGAKANRWQNAKRLLENRGQASGRGFLCRKVFGFVPKDGGAKEMGSMS